MGSKSILSLLIFTTSCVLFGVCQNPNAVPCVQKLIPCQPYLVAAPSTPPPSCCLPLKEMLATDIRCLCDVFNNSGIMKALNLTRDEALKLPKACGANAHISVCKKVAAPIHAPVAPSASANLSNSSSADNFTASPSPQKNVANGISHFGGSSIGALIVALVILVIL